MDNVSSHHSTHGGKDEWQAAISSASVGQVQSGHLQFIVPYKLARGQKCFSFPTRQSANIRAGRFGYDR